LRGGEACGQKESKKESNKEKSNKKEEEIVSFTEGGALKAPPSS